MKKNTISIITMGCPKNMVDSEKLAAKLSDQGFDVAHEKESAEIVIINTCGFINDAKTESVDEILAFSNLKLKGQIKKLIVTGCLSERYRDDLTSEIPEADAIFGVNEYDKVIEYISGNKVSEVDNNRILSTPSHYAYLKIAEGCNRTCSFCSIPLIRGQLKSRPMDALIEETKNLAEKGVKELIVIAQDTISYGLDIYGKRRIAELLKKLSLVDGIEWIRLMYTYPAAFPDDLLDEIASNEKIVKYIDLPLQHINDGILKSMNRGIDKEKTYALIKKIREKIPVVALRSSFIVGYPGEDRKSFSELYNFVKEMKFERMGVFAYSSEEGTDSYKLGDPVNHKTKMKRMTDLISLHEKNSISFNQSLVGKEIPVILDSVEENQIMGRLAFDAPEIDNVVFLNGIEFKGGMICQCKITDSGIFDVSAEITN